MIGEGSHVIREKYVDSHSLIFLLDVMSSKMDELFTIIPIRYI